MTCANCNGSGEVPHPKWDNYLRLSRLVSPCDLEAWQGVKMMECDLKEKMTPKFIFCPACDGWGEIREMMA